MPRPDPAVHVPEGVGISVVVAVFEPPPELLDALVASVLEQRLRTGAVELVLVDDGSADGTAGRLDAIAARHDAVRVLHLPASGWPGVPRNAGLDVARGDFVFFADHDDWFAPGALDRLHRVALADDADVVVGRVVGHGRHIDLDLFARDRAGVDLSWPPLRRLLTPHKLFRRAFLARHGLRFAEGRLRLEDHRFVTAAYLAAPGRVSVVADQPVYHWRLREDRGNASWRPMDPAGYFADLAAVLDVLEAGTAHGALREDLLTHWLRWKALGRFTGAAFLRRDEPHNREVMHAVADLLERRAPRDFDAGLPLADRVRAACVRRRDLGSLMALARFEAALVARARVLGLTTDGPDARLQLECRLRSTGDRFVLRAAGEQLRWEPPRVLHAACAGVDLDVTAELGAGGVRLAIGDDGDAVHPVAAETRIELAAGAKGLLTPLLAVSAAVHGDRVAAGRALHPGRWTLSAAVDLGGFRATARRMRIADADGGDRHDGARVPFVLVAGDDGRLSPTTGRPAGGERGRAAVSCR